MKLVHPDFSFQLLLSRGNVCEWIIESPELFLKYVYELRSQIDGKEGGFVLSDQTELPLTKNIVMVTDPMSVDINDRHILSKIYTELEEAALDEAHYMETQEIAAALRQYLVGIEQECFCDLQTGETLDMQQLFKAFGVKLQEEEQDFLGNLLRYMKVVSVVLKKKVIVFVNLRSYLCAEQVESLIQFASYEELSVILIENMQRDFSSRIKRFIIDSDKCEIY